MEKIFLRIIDWLMPKKNKGVLSKAILKKYLPPNPTVVEAGAHIGNDSVEMARAWKDATIHAFEPVPQLFSKLVKNTEAYSSVHCYPLALSDKNGPVEIFVSSGRSDASSSILRPKDHLTLHPEVYFEEKILANAITLDGWAADHGIEKVDMLWLDLQGYELPVLKNSLSILGRVKLIYTEVQLVESYENTALYGELKEWLMSQGFVVEHEELPWHDAGNVLFIRTEKT